MIIANFREYTTTLRDVYSHDVMGEIGVYYQSLMSSGEKLKQQKLELQKQISTCKQEISRQAQLIRSTADKRAAGLRAAEIKRQKMQLVHSLKVLQSSDHFNVLSNDAKIGVCSGFLLQKYMTKELLEHNPLNFAKDINNNLIVDPEKLRHSEMFQQALHLRDFVAAYMAKYPDKVKTPGHFKTMLNGVNDWNELLQYVDLFFERLNDDAQFDEDMIKASRQGTEVIRVFPEKGVQLVRLHTAEALDYETSQMNHCVGKGSYDKDVISGKTVIYSLRDCSPDGEWRPHATIEYKDGVITQVKGYKNKDIDPQYYPEIRAGIFDIYGTSDIAELHRLKKVRDLENWGYVIDTGGVARDYYNLNEEIELESVDVWKVPQEKARFISAQKANINGEWTEETTAKIKQFKSIQKVNVDQMSGGTVEARKYFTERTGGGANANTIFSLLSGSANMSKLGYGLRYSNQQKFIVFDDYEKLWIDLLNLTQPEKINSLEYTLDQAEQIKLELLSVHSLTISGAVTPELLETISRFRSIDNLFFKKADFAAVSQIDLSRMQNLDSANINENDFCLHLEESAMVTEAGSCVTTISKFVPGKIIRFYECRNLPDLAAFAFPQNIKHIVIDAESDKTKASAACFAQYHDLETLQLNNFNLSNTKTFTLPESITQLGFGGCTLGAVKELDFNRFPNLRTVNLKATDFKGIDHIIFPAAMTKTAAESCTFKPGAVLDYSLCNKLDNLDLSNFTGNKNACGSILVPENLKQMKIGRTEFETLEELDLSHCQKLENLSIESSKFPKLKKLVVPGCKIEQKNNKIPEGCKIIGICPDTPCPVWTPPAIER